MWLDDPTLEAEAVHQQEEVTEDSGKAGIISEYLDRLLPINWMGLDLAFRRDFIKGYKFGTSEGIEKRVRVCVAEIIEECFGNDMGKVRPLEIREIHDIMRQMPGWREGGKQRFGHQYGIQKSYIRIEKSEKSVAAVCCRTRITATCFDSQSMKTLPKLPLVAGAWQRLECRNSRALRSIVADVADVSYIAKEMREIHINVRVICLFRTRIGKYCQRGNIGNRGAWLLTCT